jgi:hypothetical protein
MIKGLWNKYVLITHFFLIGEVAVPIKIITSKTTYILSLRAMRMSHVFSGTGFKCFKNVLTFVWKRKYPL